MEPARKMPIQWIRALKRTVEQHQLMREQVSDQKKQFVPEASNWRNGGWPIALFFMLLLAGLVALGISIILLISRTLLNGNLPDRAGIVVAAIGGGLAIFGAVGMFSRLNVLRRQVANVETDHRAVMQTGQERSRSLYELAFLMGSTLNYEKIIEAALEAGRLGLKRSGADDENLLAIVLFHSDDNMLHVVSSRRLIRADEQNTVPGKSGIIGEALQGSEPIIGENPRKDPELQYFLSVQNCKSILCIPLRTGFDNFGVLIYASDQAQAFGEDQTDLLTAIGIQTTIALQNALLYGRLRDEKEKIIELEEDARKKLARDLHDGPTQSIAAIAMRMGYINRLIEKSPQQVPEELRKVEDLARKTTREIRHMLFTLRPLVLETHGMRVAMAQLAEKIQETHGQGVVMMVNPEVESLLNNHQQGVIFYIVEEAINNARKHARAQIIKVSIFKQGAYIIVQIMDNGVGFNTEAITTGYENRGSLGMINMRERAELIDATLNVESKPGTGTIITMLVPVSGEDEAGVPSAIPGSVGMTRLAIAASERVDDLGTERQNSNSRW